MKPHIKVIQRNGVDIYETSSMTMKCTKSEQAANRAAYMGMQGVQGVMASSGYMRHSAQAENFINHGGSIKFAGDRYGIMQAHSLSQSLLI
jgi:hypothetical protein